MYFRHLIWRIWRRHSRIIETNKWHLIFIKWRMEIEELFNAKQLQQQRAESWTNAWVFQVKKLEAESTHLLCKGKYHCMADLLFYLFWLSCFTFVKLIYLIFKKNGPDLAFFLFVRSFHNAKTNINYSTNLTINDKSIDGVLGTRTRGGRMEGADESTELWAEHPIDLLVWSSKSKPVKTKCISGAIRFVGEH